MKTRLFAIMFAVSMLAVLSASTTRGQTSQTIQVEVPFAFTANDKILPAGSYRIEPVSDSRAIWRIRGAQKRRGQFLLASILAGTSRGDLYVTFHRYGNKQFLAGFKTGVYEVSLPASRLEKTLRMALDPVVPIDIVGLETVTGRSR